MYRRRLTWLVIATFLLQVISPALPTLSLRTALADTAYVAKVHDRGKVMPTTQELLQKQDTPKVEARYTAPRASEENGPLLPNGTFQLAESQRATSVSTARAALGASYTSKPQKNPGGIGTYRVDVSGTISSNTTWTAANAPYVVTSTVNVVSPAVLTVEPGVDVKFASGASLNIGDGAGLIAEGTSTAPIVLTSYKDDIGGDDNGDGTATTPAAGDWGGINYNGWKSGSTCVAASGSLKFVEARYGTSILVSCSGTTMTDLKIEKMSSYGLDILNYPANRPAIERLTLLDNKWNLKLTGVPSTDTIKDSVLMRAERNAIVADSSAVHIENSRIENNGLSGTGYYAITSQSGALYLRYNTIAKNYGMGNVDYGVTSSGATVNASENWWGSTTGPEVSGQTDTGAGAKISTSVTYTNWLGKAYEEEHKRGNLPWTSKAGVGVDVSTGNFTYTETDVSIATIGFPLEVVRTYNNKTADTNVSDFGYGWSWNYGQNLNLSDGRGAAWERADGAKSYFKKNPDGTFTSEEGVYERLTYDAGTSTYTLTFKDQTKLLFNSTGKLVKLADTDGNETVVARDGAGKVLNITDPTGRQLVPTYTGNYITKIIGPLGESYNYVQTTLSTKATTTSVTKKDAALVTFASCTYQFTTYVYQMTGITDCDGNILTQTYDSTSTKRVKTQIWNGNATTEFQYGPSTLYGLTLAANSTAVWDGWDVPHVYFYTKSNKVFEKWRGVINQLGLWYEEDKWEFTGYTRSKHRNIESTWTADVIDVRTGNVTSHTEAYGSAEARTWDYGYDAFNNRTSETDPLNNTKEYEFDNEQHLVLTRDALGYETETTHYPNGLPETMTDARGNVTHLGYDANGYPASIENGEGEISTFLFNIIGWKVWEKDPELRQTSYTHNARGQVLTMIDPMGHETATDYDAKGRKTAVEDAEGNTTTTVWNTTRNSPWKTIDAEGGVLEFTLTAQGNVGSMKDPNGHTWTLAYNQFNQPTSETDPNGKVRLTEYTASGLVWNHTDAKGQVTTTLYNAFGEPTSIAYADGKTVANTYDDAGYVLSMVDWVGTHTYVRNALHRVTSYTNPDGVTVGYGFDEVGNNTSITYPGNLVVISTFDGANRQLSVEDWDGRVTTYDRDAAGRLGGFTLPNGVTTTIARDDASRVDSIVHVKGATTIASIDYSRDNVGNVTARETVAGIESYLYDAIYRITEAAYPGSDVELFEYDANGNRTRRTRGSDITNYVVDNADQLLDAGDGFRTYDNNGALLQVGSHIGLSWDAREQLVAITTAPPNTAPTANAGADFTGYVNRLILLDGRASSDPEGERLRYTWTEDGSNPQTGILRGEHAAKPGFTPTMAGTYVFSLTVHDGRTSSTADSVTVTVNAGSPPNQSYDINPATGTSGYVVSTNPNGNSFTQNNMYTGKQSSTTYYGAAQFALPALPQFYEVTAATLALTGKAVFSNTASDEWSVKILPTALDPNWTSATYTTVSAATPDATLTPTLVGIGAVVPGVVNSWTFTAGDRAVLQERAAGSGKLSVRTQGDTLGASSRVQWHSGSATTTAYRPKLSVTYAPATIPNQTPVANAGANQTVTPGTLTTLSGGDSYDLEGAITYSWATVRAPEAVTLSSSTIAAPTFTPSAEGDYVFALTVTDSASLASAANLVTVRVTKELPPSTTAFLYDGHGARVKQTEDGTDTKYLVDPTGDLARVLMETSGSSTTYMIYGHDLLYTITASGVQYHHHDALGSVVAITDAAGAVVQTYNYDVFGVLRAAAGSLLNHYTFAGEENDASGLVYLRARYYEPTVGKFPSRDSFPLDPSDTQTANRYVYVKNNPTNYVDPNGEFWQEIGDFVIEWFVNPTKAYAPEFADQVEHSVFNNDAWGALFSAPIGKFGRPLKWVSGSQFAKKFTQHAMEMGIADEISYLISSVTTAVQGKTSGNVLKYIHNIGGKEFKRIGYFDPATGRFTATDEFNNLVNHFAPDAGIQYFKDLASKFKPW